MPPSPLSKQYSSKDVNAYVTAIPVEDRALLHRLERIIKETYPGLAPQISYNMLCWRRGQRRLYVGSWKHGLSIYGWSQGRERSVTDLHPGLKSSKGTIRLTPAKATELTDSELRILIVAALAG